MEDADKIIETFESMPGFIKTNKFRIEEIKEDKVVMVAPVDENSYNPSEIVHGGLVFGLADTAMGTLAYLTGRKVVTVNSSINYLKPCRGNIIKCIAEPVKVGKAIGFYQANIYNSDNELAATITATYFFLDRDINKK